MRFVTSAVLVCASALSPTITAAPAPKPGPPRELVVVSNKTGKSQLYLVQPGTGEAKQLGDTTTNNYYPIWSPDGKQVAFISIHDGRGDIWTIKTDGTDMRQLTKKQALCLNLRWLPDGSRIAFDDRGQLHTVEVATGKVVSLANSETEGYRELEWSPDGKKLSCLRVKDEKHFLCVMTSDGKNMTQLTEMKYGKNAGWSPDGNQLMFVAIDPVDNRQVYTIGANGKNRKLLTKDLQTDINSPPQWSPDGTRIALSVMVNHMPQVAVMGTDGSNLKVLTAKHYHSALRWSPDGKSLSYTRSADGNPSAVWVSDPDGENAKEVFRSSCMPEWKPK